MKQTLQVGPEERRVLAYKALSKGSDLKLLKGSTSEARKWIQEAYDLAHEEPKLLSPLPELTAYRLAHLILRDRAINEEGLLDADQYLTEAGKEKALGPWPSLYGTAVQQRLHIDPARIASNFRRTIERAEDWVRDEGLERDFGARIQDGLINLVELCAYFIGVPYSPLEGREGLDENFFDSSAPWFLVGPDRRTAQVRYPGRLALAELDARGRDHKHAFLFELPESGLASWWSQGKPKDYLRSENFLRVLVAILRGGGSREDARHIVVGNESDDAFRKALERFKTEVTRRTGRNRSEFSQSDAQTGLPRLPENLVIFGTVNRDRLDRR